MYLTQTLAHYFKKCIRLFQLLSSSFKSSEPVSNVAEDDVSQKTSNIEEGGGYMGPLSIVAHKVKLCDQCVGILRPAFIRFRSRFPVNSSIPGTCHSSSHEDTALRSKWDRDPLAIRCHSPPGHESSFQPGFLLSSIFSFLS